MTIASDSTISVQTCHLFVAQWSYLQRFMFICPDLSPPRYTPCTVTPVPVTRSVFTTNNLEYLPSYSSVVIIDHSILNFPGFTFELPPLNEISTRILGYVPNLFLRHTANVFVAYSHWYVTNLFSLEKQFSGSLLTWATLSVLHLLEWPFNFFPNLIYSLLIILINVTTQPDIFVTIDSVWLHSLYLTNISTTNVF